MAFSIEDLKSTIGSNGGIATTNLYLVQLPTDIRPAVSGSLLDIAKDKFNEIVGSATTAINGVLGQFGLSMSMGQKDEMAVLCKGVNVPGRQLLSHDRIIGMNKSKVAYGYADEDVTMTFWVTNDMKAKEYFDTWQSMCVNVNNGTVGYYKDYVRDVKIVTLKKGVTPLASGNGFSIFGQNDTTKTIRLVEAWPTTINSISLNDEPDGLMEVTVTLSYKRWESDAGKSGGGIVASTISSFL